MSSARSAWRRLATFLRHIRSPHWGILGQGVRFAITGVVVALVYFATTTVLHLVAGLRFQVALVIGFVTGMLVHFTLQRVFVWRHHDEFALAVHHQLARYLLVSAAQYGVTAASTSLLPGALGLPLEVIYPATVLTVSGVNFLVFRGRVFHAGGGAVTPVGAPITSEFEAVGPMHPVRPAPPAPDRPSTADR